MPQILIMVDDPDEANLIIAALQAVAPTGGGSTAFHLANRLSYESGIIPKDEFVGELITTAHEEYVAAHQDEV